MGCGQAAQEECGPAPEATGIMCDASRFSIADFISSYPQPDGALLARLARLAQCFIAHVQGSP